MTSSVFSHLNLFHYGGILFVRNPLNSQGRTLMVGLQCFAEGKVFWKVSFSKSAAVMTPEIALLMGFLRAWEFGPFVTGSISLSPLRHWWEATAASTRLQRCNDTRSERLAQERSHLAFLRKTSPVCVYVCVWTWTGAAKPFHRFSHVRKNEWGLLALGWHKEDTDHCINVGHWGSGEPVEHLCTCKQHLRFKRCYIRYHILDSPTLSTYLHNRSCN